ncbi:MAG: hypothetical protein GWN71_19435, partial [Gammaproteobacteria bacterium]|nr:RICIN domain-containing protein [Gemmatimonadota bacterium]NIU75663.1 hypothetical protein [Gammaproteobacteria bacterium]NIY09624.1 hypothetical protein [Gemmatimonadota bacterium]
LVPYTLAANYPGEDFDAVLEPPTRQDRLATMIGALWDLRALREDVAFMRERPQDFALGWRESTVREWDRWLAGLQDDWLEEFQALRDRAQSCRSAGDGETDAWDELRCSDVAAAYDREEGSRSLLAERSLLPDRKTSACAAPIPVDLKANKTGPYPEHPLGFVLTHDDGRNEIDDDLHKRLHAELAVRVEQDGRLARLLLDASLEDCKLEGNRCRKDRNNWRTALRGRADKLLFDLDAPSPDGDAVSGMDQGSFEDLSECVFHETGPLSIEPLRRDGERWVYGVVDDTLSAKSVRRCRPNRRKGCMDPTLLDQVPAERKHRARGQGALRALTCAIDLQGRRDRRLACVGLPQSGLKLALVNTLDLAAERIDPPTPRPVSLPHYSRGGAPIPVPVPVPVPRGGERAEAGPAVGQRYRIRSAATGKFIAVSGGKRSNGANVIQWEDAGQRDIVWEVRPGPGESIKLRNASSGKFLAISGGKAARGQSAIQWEDAGQRDVQWVPVPAGDGTYRLRNRGTGRFLGVEGRKKANGADIIQFHTRANRAMRWRFVPAGSR